MQDRIAEPVIEVPAAAAIVPHKRRLRRTAWTIRWAENPHMEVIIVPVPHPHFSQPCAIAAGAHGYLLKDTPRQELYRAVHDVVTGRPALAPTVATRLSRRLGGGSGTVLTTREVEVLDLVRHGRANREIGQRLHISEATVKTHLIHVFTKLGVADRTAAVHVALQRGLLRLDR